MQCNDFPFAYRGKRYLADRTFSGEVAGFVAQFNMVKHLDDAEFIPRMRIESLIEGVGAGGVVFVASGPMGPRSRPILASLRGMDRVHAYLTLGEVELYEVLEGRGPQARIRRAGEEGEMVGADLIRRAKLGHLLLLARLDPGPLDTRQAERT